jgi:hypothetical protein
MSNERRSRTFRWCAFAMLFFFSSFFWFTSDIQYSPASVASAWLCLDLDSHQQISVDLLPTSSFFPDCLQVRMWLEFRNFFFDIFLSNSLFSIFLLWGSNKIPSRTDFRRITKFSWGIRYFRSLCKTPNSTLLSILLLMLDGFPTEHQFFLEVSALSI